MAIAAAKARPYRMVSIKVSDICELARWLLQRAGIAVDEEFHAPLLHIFTTIPMGAGIGAPAIVTPDGLWIGKLGIIQAVDAHSRDELRFIRGQQAGAPKVAIGYMTRLLGRIR